MKTFLLFDIDGTLVYSERRDSRCFATAYASVFGRPFPTLDWTRFTEVTDHVIFRTAYHDAFGRYPTPTERHDFEEVYLDALRRNRRADPAAHRAVAGAVTLWRDLSANDDYVLGLATGGWRRPAAVKLDHVGIPPDQPYASYANDKFSRRDILNEAIDLARRDHEIDRVVYVGDAVWDVTTTTAMDLPLIGVARTGDHRPLRDLGVRNVFTDFTDQERFLTAVRG